MKEIDGQTTALPYHLIQMAKYKWEFLRRNPRYIKSYEKMQKTMLKTYGDWAPPDDMLTREEIDFCKIWKIGLPLSPYQSYSDFTSNEAVQLNPDGTQEIVKAKILDCHRRMHLWMFPGFLHARSIMPLDFECFEENRIIKRKTAPSIVAEKGNIRVELDLNYSKSRLLRDFKDFIDEWKPLYDESEKRKVYFSFCKEHDVPIKPEYESLNKQFEKHYREHVRKKKQQYEPKYHFDNYDQYLKVYDLKKSGLNWYQIVDKLKLNDIQTARNYYNTARKLIERGITIYVKTW